MVWLDNSRILAIYAVVCLHIASGIVLGNDIGSSYWWVGNIYDSFLRWCVPVFVMISGALLLDPNKKESLFTFYAKRLDRIIVPLLFWSVFFIFWSALMGILTGNEPASIPSVLKRILVGKPYYHMWFLYMILGLYLFTPFFRKIVTDSSERELIFLISLLFVFASLNFAYDYFLGEGDEKLFINTFIFYTPYFFLGHLIQRKIAIPPKTTLLIIFVISFLSTCIGCYAVGIRSGLHNGLYFYHYLSITVIPMAISVFCLLRSWISPVFNKKVTKKLTSLTLGIYLIHPIMIDLANLKGLVTTWLNPIISVPVMATVVFVISLICAWTIYQVPYLKRII